VPFSIVGPDRVAEMRGVAGALDPEHISPLFMELAPATAAAIGRQGAAPGLFVDDPARTVIRSACGRGGGCAAC
jgi:hypothetical protein